MSADYIRAVPTIDLPADELAAVTAAIRRVIEGDRYPHAPRLDPLRAAPARLDAAAPGANPALEGPRRRPKATSGRGDNPTGLDPNTWRSAPALEPSKGEQDERYDERTDRVLDGDVSGVRLEPREKRGKATRWNEPVHGGNGKEQDTKKSGDQRQGSVHRAVVRGDRKFSVTASVRYTPAWAERRAGAT